MGFYAVPGRFTEPTTDQLEVVARLGRGPQGRCIDLLIDQLAVACHCHDEPELERIYQQLSVPAALIC